MDAVRTAEPETIHLAEGDRAFNYYDRKPGVIGKIDDTGWFHFRQDDGTVKVLNGERICSTHYAEGRGWL